MPLFVGLVPLNIRHELYQSLARLAFAPLKIADIADAEPEFAGGPVLGES